MIGSKRARLLVAAIATATVLGGALIATAQGTSPTNDRASRPSAGTRSDGVEFAARGHHTAKLHYMSYAASAFAPDSVIAVNGYFNQWDPTRLSSDTACFNTGVLLPDGARIVAVRFFYQQSASEFNGELNRQQLGTSHFKLLATVSPADTSNTIKFISKKVNKHLGKVNNLKYAYALGVCPPHSSGTSHGFFRGAQIAYAD